MLDFLQSVQQLTATAPFWWVALALLALILTYINVGRWVWLGLLLAVLVTFTLIASDAPLWTRLLAWPVALIPWLVFALPALRRPLISHRVLEHLRARVPSLTPVELTTLRTGNVWWEGAFFAGAPNWRRMMEIKPARLTESERRFLLHETVAACDLAGGADDDLAPALLDYLRSKKFFALAIPPRYSGLGYSRCGVSAVLTRVATRYPAVSLSIAAALAPTELILRFGTDAQKDRLLPAIAGGDAIPALAVSGLEAGSDLSAMGDNARVVRDGDALVLDVSFAKRYVTLAPYATHLVVAVRVADSDDLPGNGAHRGMSLVVVPVDTPGVEAGRRHRCVDPMLVQGPVTGRSVRIGLDGVLGGSEGIGRGWQMLSELQVATRALGVPAAATGAAKLLSLVSGDYARIRFQFREPIGALPGVQELLARIGAQTYGLEALRRVTMAAFAAGKEPAVISSIAKYQSAERLRAVTDDALHVHSAKALCRGERNLLEPFLHLPALSASLDGPNLLSRNLTIYGQGLLRSHPFVARELEAVRDDDRLRGEQRFDELFGEHMAFTASSAVRTLLLSVAGGRLVLTPRRAGWTARWFRRLSRMSAAFALTNDAMLALFGGDLKTRQRESARMADILGLLYTAAAVLKFHREQGMAADERPLVEYLLHDCFWQIQRRFDALFTNLPRLAGWSLRRMVFPFGRPYRRQPDSVEASVARLLLAPSAVRNRLIGGIALPGAQSAPLNLLEQAYARVVEDKPLYRKLSEAHSVKLVTGNNMSEWLDCAAAANVLNADQVARLRETEALRLAALAVDDYAAH